MSKFERQLSSAALVCLDGNIPVSTVNYVCSLAKKHNINGKHRDIIVHDREHALLMVFDVMLSLCVTVWYEPTDAKKACKPFLSDAWKSLSYSSPNLTELCIMNETLGITTPEGKVCSSINI